MPADSLYRRLERAGGLRRIVAGLYQRVLGDAVLVPYFKPILARERGMRWLRWHLMTFLAAATGGPSKYQGRDLATVHAGVFITGEAYDRLLVHLLAAMTDLGVARQDREDVVLALLQLRPAVVTFDPEATPAEHPPLEGEPPT